MMLYRSHKEHMKRADEVLERLKAVMPEVEELTERLREKATKDETACERVAFVHAGREAKAKG